jgi:hypothetical protein
MIIGTLSAQVVHEVFDGVLAWLAWACVEGRISIRIQTTRRKGTILLHCVCQVRRCVGHTIANQPVQAIFGDILAVITTILAVARL